MNCAWCGGLDPWARQGCRFGGGAVKAIELTWGGLRHVPLLELGKS